jgi:hypothetical protein
MSLPHRWLLSGWSRHRSDLCCFGANDQRPAESRTTFSSGVKERRHDPDSDGKAKLRFLFLTVNSACGNFNFNLRFLEQRPLPGDRSGTDRTLTGTCRQTRRGSHSDSRQKIGHGGKSGFTNEQILYCTWSSVRKPASRFPVQRRRSRRRGHDLFWSATLGLTGSPFVSGASSSTAAPFLSR